MNDDIVTPERTKLITGYEDVREAALEAGRDRRDGQRCRPRDSGGLSPPGSARDRVGDGRRLRRGRRRESGLSDRDQRGATLYRDDS